MKKYLFLFLGCAALMQSCGSDAISPAQNIVTDPAKAAKWDFPIKKHNFDTITAGEKVSYAFKFKNTSDVNPLVISNAVGTCGCTVPEYPKEPVAPGAEAEILVVFNSTGKIGKQTKKVTLQANTIPSEMELTIEAQVREAKKDSSATITATPSSH